MSYEKTCPRQRISSARQYQGQVHPTSSLHIQCGLDENQKHWEKAESKVRSQWDVMVEKIILDLRDT